MARKTKKTKRVSVPELQAYIDGAIEFNEVDWHPNKDQWDKIVEMIMTIKEEAPPTQSPNGTTANVQPLPTYQEPRQPVQISGGSTLDAEPVPFNESSAPKTDMRQISAEQMVPMQGGAVDGVHSSGMKIKTPTIDTADKAYDSPFG